MSWAQFLADKKVRPHVTSLAELEALRAVVARDLADAAITDLSTDRRFATAYNAVLQVSKMIIACTGYRVSGLGHHQTTFEAVELAVGPSVASLMAYFDTCRRKRNMVDYDMANVTSETEMDEIIAEAGNFRQMAETWIAANHPHLKPVTS